MTEPVVIDYCHVHGYADGGQPDAFDQDTILWELPCRTEEWSVVMTPDGVVTQRDEAIHLNEPFYTLRSGDLAYIFTVRGVLVPCKVLVVKETGETEVLVTADRDSWSRGERVCLGSPKVSLVNRSQVSRRKGRPRIRGTLRMVTDGGVTLP